MVFLIVICLAFAALIPCLWDRQIRNCRKRSHRLRIALMLLALLLALTACTKGKPAESEQAQDLPETGNDAQTEQDVEPAEAPPSPAPEQKEEPVPEEEPAPEAPEPEEPSQSEGEEWKLILVNADQPLPEDYSVTLKELRNDQWVDERIYPELQQMFDDARAEGIYPLINESFRTAERQQEILDSYVASYEAEGLDREEAEAQALAIAAKPGTSEHQLGLALDIVSETDEDDTPTWQWLEANCWRYGFILRYPDGKTEITGISYEPWHFRYVGKEAAQEITERGITLEEYLKDGKAADE